MQRYGRGDRLACEIRYYSDTNLAHLHILSLLFLYLLVSPKRFYSLDKVLMTAIPTPIRSDPKELTPEPKTPPVEILKEGLFQPTEIYNALPTPPETPEKSRKAFSTSAGPSTLSLGRPKPETPKSVLFQPRTLDSDKLKPEIFNSALFQPIDTTDLPNTRDSSSQDHEERIPQSFLLSTLLRILRKAPAYIVATTYNKAQVTKLVHFIRELREGNPKNSEWSAWKLNRSGYEQLLDRVNNDAELCGYFYDKLRLVPD